MNVCFLLYLVGEPPNGFNGLKFVQSQGSISSRICQVSTFIWKSMANHSMLPFMDTAYLQVVVSTKSPKSDKQYVWEAVADSSSYVIKEETDPEKMLTRGTQITLFLRVCCYVQLRCHEMFFIATLH